MTWPERLGCGGKLESRRKESLKGHGSPHPEWPFYNMLGSLDPTI